MTTFLHRGGGYRNLRAYQLSEAMHDLTSVFVERFIEKGSRTKDQMIQAARSGKQNIAEGSEASTTSKETEIKLTNVAKASLEELLLDYEDYLRQHFLPIWDKSSPRVLKLREYLRADRFIKSPLEFAQKMNAEEFCNLCITLINQTTYLLGRLLEKQQEQFLKEGGIREQMTRARIAYRNSQTTQTSQTSQTSQTVQTSPTSPTGPTSQTGQTRPTGPTPDNKS